MLSGDHSAEPKLCSGEIDLVREGKEDVQLGQTANRIALLSFSYGSEPPLKRSKSRSDWSIMLQVKFKGFSSDEEPISRYAT